MVTHVLGQTGVLSQRKELVQPAPIQSRQWEKQHWKPTSDGSGPADHSRIDEEIRTGPPEHFSPLALGHEIFCLFAGDPQGMQNHYLEHLDRIGDPEEVKKD